MPSFGTPERWAREARWATEDAAQDAADRERFPPTDEDGDGFAVDTTGLEVRCVSCGRWAPVELCRDCQIRVDDYEG